MELTEQVEWLCEKIFKLEPDHATTIIEYIILNTNEHDIIQLVLCSDNVFQCFITNVKCDLRITETVSPILSSSPSLSSVSISDPYSPPFSSYTPSPSSRQFLPNYSNFSLQTLMQYLSLEDQLLESVNSVGSDHLTHCGGFYSDQQQQHQQGMVGVRSNRRFPVKVCHFFNKGYCKHGSKCRYFHGENGNDEQLVIRGRNLENLEMEIVELLKSRRGIPISIASLPMVYYEQYGKILQADGYLTESQRNGKAGFNLTKLLATLNSICVLDRPHGQHSVILAEDALRKNVDFSENSARQIYLTFPAESTFTEQDVSNYFSKYGPVDDVRIPCQQSRMYGFVTFVYVETAKHILSTTTTHFVCGAQVLVKPYKEKSKLSQRKNVEKPTFPYYIQNSMEGELEEPKFVARVCDGSRLMMRRHLNEQNDLQQQYSEYLLTSKNTPPFPYLGLSANKFAHSSGNGEMHEFSSTEKQLHELLDSGTDYPNESKQDFNLPDSLFTHLPQVDEFQQLYR